MDKKSLSAGKEIRQRAGGVLEKSAKRDLIILAAEKLMKGREYDLPSVNEIISASGIAKGTFYLYFKTKEEIYIAILEKYHALLFDALDRSVEEAKDRDEFMKLTAESMLQFAKKNPKSMYLSFIANVILENNLEIDTALSFKKFSANRIGSLLTRLTAKFKMDPEAARQNLILSYNLWLSLWQYANPPKDLEKLRKNQEISGLFINFEDSFRIGMQKIWK